MTFSLTKYISAFMSMISYLMGTQTHEAIFKSFGILSTIEDHTLPILETS